MRTLEKILAVALLCSAFAGCEKEDQIPESVKITPITGVFILNQGNFQHSSGSISYLDLETGDFVADIAAERLGDSPQDLLIYGSKLYVSVAGSNRIWVFDLNDLDIDKAVAIDPTDSNNKPYSPNYFAAKDDKVYVTSISGNVLRIDTASLTVDGVVKSGTESEGIAEYNGKLYVANINRNDYTSDNTLSVIDLASFTVERKITVGVNPFRVRSDNKGSLYISYRGNYSTIPDGFQKIDLTNNDDISEINIRANGNFSVIDDHICYIGVVWSDDYTYSTNYSGKYNLTTHTDEIWITLPTNVASLYSLGVDPVNGDIYIGDSDYSNPGNVYVYSKEGELKQTIKVGLNPYTFAFK